MSWNSKIIELISLHAEGDKEAYQKFFKSAMDKFNIKSPTELDGDKKKEFFNYIDKNYDAKNEDLDPYKDFDGSPKEDYNLNLGAFVDEYQKFLKFMKKHKEVPDKNKREWALAIRKKVGQGMFNGHIHSFEDVSDLLSMGDKFRNLKESVLKENPAVIATAARMAIQNAQGKKVSVNTARQKDYREKDPKAYKKAKSIFDKIKDKLKSKKKPQAKGQKLKTTNNKKSDAQKYSDLYGGGAKVESTKAYAQTLTKMAKDRQLKNISKKDKDMLMKIAQMMKTANEGALSSKIKKAIMIAIQMSGNMTGAVNKIEKMAKGLSKDKKVAGALRLANESKINEKADKKAIKNFLDAALKQAGIKVLKHKEMKPGTTRAVYGCFYTVKAASGNDVLPFYVYKNGKIELGVSSKGFWPGKYGEMSKVVKQLKDFKSTDLDKG